MQLTNTLKLKVGDVVHAHGCRFLLMDRLEFRPGRWNGTQYIEGCLVVNFATRLLERSEHAVMPLHWARNWHIQGNELAFWFVEV